MKRASRFSCPKCRSSTTAICRVTTSKTDGFIIRHRRCIECSHSWYTGQDPEYLISRERIGWDERTPFLK